MEMRDENQILDEIRGNVIQEFVYSFPVGNREVIGLSYAGVKQVALKMGSIDTECPIIDERDDSWIVKIKATDTRRNLSLWGVCMQSKMMKLRGGGSVVDDFALQKCVSKAERNALKKLMPERIIIEMIKQWKDKSKMEGENNG